MFEAEMTDGLKKKKKKMEKEVIYVRDEKYSVNRGGSDSNDNKRLLISFQTFSSSLMWCKIMWSERSKETMKPELISLSSVS